MNRMWIVFAGIALAMAGSNMAWAWEFYDNFDDGNYDGWTVMPAPGFPASGPPDVVPSPEGFSLRGTGSGYGPPDWSNYLTHPISLNNAQQLTIEMRAKSGPQAPNEVTLKLIAGTNPANDYRVRDYGEANETADWQLVENGQDTKNWRYDIGPRAHEWHTFAWTRDSAGWWSLAIDGTVEWPDFVQDMTYTSFNTIEIQLHRDQSEIEWLRITPEPASLSLLALGGLAMLRRRRR